VPSPPIVLHSAWLPTNDAAAFLGIHRRTLVRRARGGKIETREGEDGAVEYQVTPAMRAGGRATGGATGCHTPPMASGRATPPEGAPPAAILLSALSEALIRAGRAEAERDAARAELEAERDAHERTLAAARALEAAHVKRGRLLRRLAARG
jgi:hypothetical protein